jgi:hypothetical protein
MSYYATAGDVYVMIIKPLLNCLLLMLMLIEVSGRDRGGAP